MKKILSLIISFSSAVMISAAAPAAAAESNVAGFNDVSASDWFSDAVQYVTERNLFNGTEEHGFSPDMSMTRGMFVTVLGRTAENMRFAVPDVSAEFSDVDSGTYYSKYIAWAADKGIVNGMGDGLFAPDSDVTREQMCKIFVEFFRNFLQMNLPDVNQKVTFGDSADISGWAAEYVEKAQTAGLIEGYERDGQTVFDPQSSVTRAAAATIFMRADKIKDALIDPNTGEASPGNSGSDNNSSSGGGNSGGTSGGNGSSSGGTSGGGSSSGGGNSGGTSGGNGSSSGGASTEEVKTAVGYMRSIVDGYDSSSALVAVYPEDSQSCLKLLVDCIREALSYYDSGGELSREYVHEHYSSQISNFRSAYNGMDSESKAKMQSLVLNWASYSQLMYLYDFFK